MNSMATPVFWKGQRRVKQRQDISQRRSRVDIKGPKEREHFVNANAQRPPVDGAVVTHARFGSTREDLRSWKKYYSCNFGESAS